MANLLANSTFEVDATNWTANSSTISRDTTTPRTGVGCLKIVTSNLAVAEGAFSARTANGSMLPSVVYEATAWVNAPAAAALKLGIEWHNAADALISASEHTFTGNGAYQRIDFTATSPAATDHALLYMYTTAKQAITVFMDDCYLGAMIGLSLFAAHGHFLNLKGIR